MKKHVELAITDAHREQPQNDAASLLCAEIELSKAKIKDAVEKGALWLERGTQIKRFRRLKNALRSDDILHFYYDSEVLEQHPLNARLLANEGAYSIWYKPSGMFTQGSKWGDHCSITRVAEKLLDRNAFLVHRIDRATEGLMILAHSKKMATIFSKMFAEREVKKIYHATVNGSISEDDLPIRIDQALEGKEAITLIQKVLRVNENSSRLEISIETGRKHQIRQHLALLGYPILGDRLYGDDHSVDLQLSAFELAFICPIEHKPKRYCL